EGGARRGRGADDRVPAPVSPDARRARHPARPPGGGPLLEDGGPPGLEGQAGSGPAARPGAGRAAGPGEPGPVLWGALMPWPEPLGRLLALRDSRSAQALRWGLRGLRASLEAALDDVQDDPGGADLRVLLDELAALLDRTDRLSDPLLPVNEGGTPAPDSPRLLSLAGAMATDVRLALAGAFSFRRGSDEEIWNDTQLLLLRVP